MKLSAVIITRNEADRIKQSIDALSFCDEIIVVDNDSADDTQQIAKRNGARVLQYASDSFSKSRNFGLQQANGEWLLYVDADEIVTKELQQSIINAIKTEKNHAYVLQRKNYYFGRYEWPNVEQIERLFHKQNLHEWYGKLHESPRFSGRKGKLSGYLLHFTHRDLESMVEKTILWSKKEAELRLHANHPKMTWWRFPRVMFTSFFNSYLAQGGWKAGTAGLMESLYQSFSIFVTYARLWEMQYENRKNIQK